MLSTTPILDDLTKGINAINLHSLIMHILTTYAQISQPDLGDNMTNFNSGINLDLPLAIYARKQEKCQVFAAAAGVPISDETIITTGTIHALACGNMTLPWQKWKRCLLPNHTTPNWKTHWTADFTKMKNIDCMTAREISFGANQATKIEQAQQMESSLNNFANASIQKNTTINNLVATNAMLTKAIADTQLSIA